MPFDSEFAAALIDALGDVEVERQLPSGELPNPLGLSFITTETKSLLVYARRLTAQERVGADPSSHGRPQGELHLQMIFDHDVRGQRGKLKFEAGTLTLLLGYYWLNDGYIVAAYDASRRQEYGYSASLQLKRELIEQAAKTGLVFHTRKNGETVVIFRLEFISNYIENSRLFHEMVASASAELQSQNIDTLDREVRNVILQPRGASLPHLVPTERRRVIEQVSKYLRDYRFTGAILSVYDRCAICGFQFDYVLDAAHIVPVAQHGTDTYDNGMGLCPRCHRMYDKGYILVDGAGKIYINPRHAEEYDQMGLAGSLQMLNETLRDEIWRPADPRHHPSPHNLQRTFEERK